MRKGSIFTAIGLLLIAAALCITAYNIFDSNRAAKVANEMLEKLEIAAPIEEIDKTQIPAYQLNPKMEMPVETVDGYEYIGILKIPTLQLELPIMSEWSYANLKVSACRYAGSVYLDNMVLAAHNYQRHFGMLADVSAGAEVKFVDITGNEFTYEVIEVETLNPTAIEEMVRSEHDLTLFTCTIGGRSRVTVRCDRISPEW